jgi:hypothetical protein
MSLARQLDEIIIYDNYFLLRRLQRYDPPLT